MYSKSHLAISVALGAIVAFAVGTSGYPAVLLVGYAALLGTAIDLDHFVIARLGTGDWRHLRFAATHPRTAFVAQGDIFEEGAVGTLTRLLSHVLLGALVVAGFWLVRRPFLAVFSAAILYAHVVCDLVSGVWKYEL